MTKDMTSSEKDQLIKDLETKVVRLEREIDDYKDLVEDLFADIRFGISYDTVGGPIQ